MSKSYDNSIYLGDDEETTAKKVRAMLTDPAKIRRNDPGHPEICPVFKLWKLIAPESQTEGIAQECRSGALGCVQDKTAFADALNAYLRPLRERRAFYKSDPALVARIIAEGTERTRDIAAHVLGDVKRAMKLT
jgi:tryptophanyl-tRNA synthetase